MYETNRRIYSVLDCSRNAGGSFYSQFLRDRSSDFCISSGRLQSVHVLIAFQAVSNNRYKNTARTGGVC